MRHAGEFNLYTEMISALHDDSRGRAITNTFENHENHESGPDAQVTCLRRRRVQEGARIAAEARHIAEGRDGRLQRSDGLVQLLELQWGRENVECMVQNAAARSMRRSVDFYIQERASEDTEDLHMIVRRRLGIMERSVGTI